VNRLKVAPAMGRIWLTRKIRSRCRMGSTGRTSLNLRRKTPAETARMRPEMRNNAGSMETGVYRQGPMELKLMAPTKKTNLAKDDTQLLHVRLPIGCRAMVLETG
jgi:hypothetical protein